MYVEFEIAHSNTHANATEANESNANDFDKYISGQHIVGRHERHVTPSCLASRIFVTCTFSFIFVAFRSKHTCINYYKCITYFQHTSCSFVFDQNALADGESGDFNQRFYTYTSFTVSIIRLGVAICKLLVGSQQFMDVVS